MAQLGERHLGVVEVARSNRVTQTIREEFLTPLLFFCATETAPSSALGISLSDFFDFDDTVIKLRGKEAILVKIYRELSPMSQDTLIKVAKCMK